MLSRLFKSQNKRCENQNHVENFLLNFPEVEFWRFFVERARYEHGHIIYRLLYCAFTSVSWDVAVDKNIADIQCALKDKTIHHVYEVTRHHRHQRVARFFDEIFKEEEKRHLPLSDFLSKQRGWVGFEQKEPGYLLGVTKGLSFIFDSFAEQKELSLSFIKDLHKISTQGVRKMLRQQHGAFRKGAIFWRLDSYADTWAGMIENIDYARQVEMQMGVSGLQVIIYSADEITETIDRFANVKSSAVAQKIWQAIHSGGAVRYQAWEGGVVNTEQFLTQICSSHIDKLKQSLLLAETKKDKLIAIFTFLKFTVLHHVFTDGVGRNFSMLLVLYLLMRENLPLVILTDSNHIPGHSVSELVAEYFRAEKEMDKVLKDHSHISSSKFCQPNVRTVEIFNSLEEQERRNYLTCLEIFRGSKIHLMGAISNQSQLNEVENAKTKIHRS